MKDSYAKIFQLMSGVIKNLGFYPPEHASIQKQVEDLIGRFNEALSGKKQVTIGAAEDILFFDDVQFYEMTPAMEELKDKLEDKGITGLIISVGVTDEELNSALQILSFSRDKVPSGGVGVLFRQMNIRNITLDEIEVDIDERAREVYTSAKESVLSVMREARLGKVPQANKAVDAVRGMQEIILTDRNALLGLTMLSDYDNYTFNHSVNVGVLSSTLAVSLGFDSRLAGDTGLAGLLHDVGKTNTPIEIINKPGKLSADEWAAIKRHPVEGAEIVAKMPDIDIQCSLIIREHHAKFDLTGYPTFPEGHKLNEGSMVVAIADTYDSMTTLRPYQKRFDPKEALQIMVKMRGSAFRPDFLDEFIRILGIYPVGTLVRLDTGEIALVSGVNPEISESPKVKIIFDAAGRNLGKNFFEIDLADQDPEEEQRNVVATLDPMSKNIDISIYN